MVWCSMIEEIGCLHDDMYAVLKKVTTWLPLALDLVCASTPLRCFTVGVTVLVAPLRQIKRTGIGCNIAIFHRAMVPHIRFPRYIVEGTTSMDISMASSPFVLR